MALPVDVVKSALNTIAPRAGKPSKLPKPGMGGGGNSYAQIQKLLAGSHLNPAQTSALMAYIAGGGKGGPGMGPVATQAQNEIDPIIAAITGQADAQAQAADKAIAGYTNSYAKQIAGINYGQPYSSAEGQQAAVDAAIRDSLGAQGGQLGDQLSGALSALQGSSGSPAVNQEAAALASQGKQSGNTQFASGSADLSNLIADAAASNEYGKKMPGVVKLAGLQGIGQSQGQAQSEIMQGVSQAEGELPSIEQQIKTNRQNAQALKADRAYKQAELGLSSQRNQISEQRALISEKQGAARLGIEQQNANTAAERAAQSAFNSNRNYKLALGRLGIEQKSLQIRQLSLTARLQGGGYTPEETRKMQLQANVIAGDAMKHTADLQQLMHTMALNDIPTPIGLKAAKMAGYQPGKVGMFSGLGNAFRKAMAQTASGLLNPGNGGRGGEGVGPSGAQNIFPSAQNHAGGFLPKGQSFIMDRKDQGRDIQTRPGAPIIAPGDGYVVRIASDPGGGGAHFGPRYPVVHFTSGPYAGKDVYIGHTVAAMRPGQRFRSGSVLSHTQKSGPMNGGAPSGWAEIGFAPGGSPGSFGQESPF